MSVVIIIFAAISYRIGGSEWTGHDSSLRGLRVAKLALRASPLAVAAVIFGLTFWLVAAVWVATAATDSLPHGQWQGTINPAQVMMMSVVTLATTVPCAAALLYGGDIRHAVAALIAGALGGPATCIGNKISVHFRVGPIGFNRGPELGEVARGLVRMLFVTI